MPTKTTVSPFCIGGEKSTAATMDQQATELGAAQKAEMLRQMEEMVSRYYEGTRRMQEITNAVKEEKMKVQKKLKEIEKTLFPMLASANCSMVEVPRRRPDQPPSYIVVDPVPKVKAPDVEELQAAFSLAVQELLSIPQEQARATPTLVIDLWNRHLSPRWRTVGEDQCKLRLMIVEPNVKPLRPATMTGS